MSQWRAWMKARFVSDWRSCWKWLSVQLAALASLLFAWLLAYPETILQTVNMLPAELRPWCPPALSLGLFVVVVGARLWKQGRPPTTPGKPK